MSLILHLDSITEFLMDELRDIIKDFKFVEAYELGVRNSKYYCYPCVNRESNKIKVTNQKITRYRSDYSYALSSPIGPSECNACGVQLSYRLYVGTDTFDIEILNIKHGYPNKLERSYRIYKVLEAFNIYFSEMKEIDIYYPPEHGYEEIIKEFAAELSPDTPWELII